MGVAREATIAREATMIARVVARSSRMIASELSAENVMR